MINIEEVFKIGLGGCPLGGHGWGKSSNQDLNEVVQCSLDLGVNFLDTADVYGLGKSEQIISSNISSSNRDNIFLATKFGVRFDSNAAFYDNSEEWFWNALHESLRRLKVDFIDLYQVHYWDQITNFEDIYSYFEKAIDQGKIRFMGVSNIDRSELTESLPNFFKTFSFELNLLEQENRKKIDAFLENKDTYFISWGSLCQGLLSGHIDESTVFNDQDRRNRDIYKHFHQDLFESNLLKISKLKRIADEINVSMSSFSLNWILEKYARSIALFGSIKPDEVLENISDQCYRIDKKYLKIVDSILND